MKPSAEIAVIGRKIRAIRKSKRLSQETLAELAGLHPTYISDMENGKVNASLLSYIMIAKGLQMPVAELIDIPEGRTDEKTESAIGELLGMLRGLPKTKQGLFLTAAKGLAEGMQKGR